MAMKVSVIRNFSELSVLACEWGELLVNSGANSIFLTWEWVCAWLRVHPEKNLLVVVVRGENGQLVAIVPFYVSDMYFLNIVKYRTLRVIGDVESGSEYPDWIIRKGEENLVLDVVAQALKSLDSEWDCIWMPRVAGWTSAKLRMKRVCDRAGFSYRERAHEFSGFPLPRCISDYERGLTKNRKQQLRRQRKKVYQSGDVSVIRCVKVEDIELFLGKLFELNKERWNKAGLKGTFEKKPKEEAFYRKFVPVALNNSWLVLIALQDGGEIKSVQIGYIYNRCFYQLQEGFDLDYIAGVGNVLRYEVITFCIDFGVDYYDFLGEFTEHKRRWGAEKRHGSDVFIGNGSAKTKFLLGNGFWPSGKYLSFVS